MLDMNYTLYIIHLCIFVKSIIFNIYTCTCICIRNVHESMQKEHIHWLLIAGKEGSKHKTAEVGWK